MTTSVPRFTFGPLGIETSRVGLGCAGLVGRESFRRSARLIETALDLGIRYFDVAPLYGMGTAEEVVGAVVGGCDDVVIATKVGIPRPPYSSSMAILRRLTKPILDRSRPLKTLARSLYVRSQKPKKPQSDERQRRDLSRDLIFREIDESLRLLRRSRIDAYLVHEPIADELDAAAADVFETLLRDGRIGCYGAAITAVSPPWMPFGAVWQSGWGGPLGDDYPSSTGYVFHGIIRNATKDAFGRAVASPSALLRTAMTEAPHGLFLVATSTPDKLRRLVSEVME